KAHVRVRVGRLSLRQRARLRAPAGGVRDRRYLAVGGLADEPGAAVDRVEVLVPVRRARARVVVGAAADACRAGLRTSRALHHELGHLLRPELAALPALELGGALERRAVLVLVRVR